MEKYIEKFENRIPACLDVPWIRDNILEMLDGEATSMDIYRWRSAIYYPPVEMLVKLSKITRQPTAYLIGQTDVLKEIEGAELKPVDINALLNTKGMSVSNFAQAAGTTNSTMRDLMKRFPYVRTNSLIAMAVALDVSTDFLLGLSSHPRWEDAEPFSNVKAGEPAYIVAEDGEILKYCLLGEDGKTVYFADGTSCEKEKLKWNKVVPVNQK